MILLGFNIFENLQTKILSSAFFGSLRVNIVEVIPSFQWNDEQYVGLSSCEKVPYILEP